MKLFSSLLRKFIQEIYTINFLIVKRTDLLKTVPMTALSKKTIALLFSLSLLFAATIPLDAQWKQLNVGQPGEVHVVAAIGNNVFAGTSAGIYRSTDFGKKWTNVSSYYADCFVVMDSEIIAGTYMNGVIHSKDGGITWNMTDTSFHKEINAITVDGNYIFAGGGGMYRSTDRGANWNVIQNGLQYGQTTVTGIVATEGKIIASTFDGVVVSVDSGNDWSTLVTTNDADVVTNCISIIDSTVLVGWPGGIIRSTDDGRSWYVPSGYISTSATFSIIGDSSRIYAGTISGVHISTDNGLTWTPVNIGFPGEQAWWIAKDDTNIFSATNLGVYHSTNEGASWSPVSNGIIGWGGDYITGNGSNIFTYMSSPTGGSFLLYNSTDNGNTWKVDTSMHCFIQSMAFSNQAIYAATNCGIFESINNGESWSGINGGVMDTVYPVSLVESNSNLIVSAQEPGMLFLSTDNGTTWANVGKNLPRIGPLAVSGQYVYAGNEGDWGNNNDGIYRSSDGGLSWTQINDTLVNISSIVASGSNIIAGRYFPPVPVGTSLPPPGGVFISTDNGQSWSSYVNGLPQNPHVNSLAMHGDNIFVGLSSAYGNYSGPIYSSSIGKEQWKAIGDGLPIARIQSIYVNDSSVFVGIIDAGVWRIPLSGLTYVKHTKTNSTPIYYRLEQNYPNPFNPSTIIEYSIPIESKIKLEIFDILGRKISTLENKDERAGIHQVKFNASGLASGIYFYQLRAGNIISTKKMLLLK